MRERKSFYVVFAIAAALVLPAAIALRTVAPIGTAAPQTEERVGPIPVVRAGDGWALAERLDGMDTSSDR